MVGSLEGMVAVVTGAGRGIGRAEATRLAAYGARVVINDTGGGTDGSPLAEDPAAEVAAEIRAAGGQAVASRDDISTSAGADAVIAAALSAWGQLDIVVNNAGIGRPRMVFNLADEEWDDVIRVHLRGTFGVSRAACRWWRDEAKAGRRSFGRLISTSTGLLLAGAGAGQSNYVAAKAGVLAFDAAVATEMAPYGVTVNTIMPGAATRLAGVGWRMGQTVERTKDWTFDSRDPVHVAELVCYIASPAAGWLNGQTFQITGGRVQHLAPVAFDRELARTDRPYTAVDFGEVLPRLFGAAAHPAELPPPEWQAAYRRKQGS